MRDKAYREINGTWTLVTAEEVLATKRDRERFLAEDDRSLMLRHHGGCWITPHFEVEPRWNT